MRCPHCGRSLDMLRGNIDVKCCPFCMQPIEIGDLLETSIEKLTYLVNREGKSIFLKENRDRLNEYLCNWPITLQNDIDILRILEIKNIPEAIVLASDSSDEVAKEILQKCVNSLTNEIFIRNDKVLSLLSMVAAPIGFGLDGYVYEHADNHSPKVRNENIIKSENLGAFTDIRDNQEYKIVKIGNQIWFAENLNYSSSDSYVYGNNSEKEKKYGRLYTWDAANDAVPYGWHLPSKNEFETLIKYVGGRFSAGKKLKMYSGGENSNSVGFEAVPAGFKDCDAFLFDDRDECAYFWTSTEQKDSNAYRISLESSEDDADVDYCSKNYAFSVRCIKD